MTTTPTAVGEDECSSRAVKGRTASPKSERQQALDEVWRAVDALGGAFDTSDPRACGYDRALCDAIKEIENLGGKWS